MTKVAVARTHGSTTTTLHSRASQVPVDYAGDDAYDALSIEVPATTSSSSTAKAAKGGAKRKSLVEASAGVKARAPPKKRAPLTEEQKQAAAIKKQATKEADAAAVAAMRAQRQRITDAEKEAYAATEVRINPSAIRAIYRFLGAQRVSELAVQYMVMHETQVAHDLYKRQCKITLMRNGRTISLRDAQLSVNTKPLISFQA